MLVCKIAAVHRLNPSNTYPSGAEPVEVF